MAVNSFLSNQGTQTALLTDNTGGTGGTLVPVYKLSMDAQGTFTTTNIFQGTLFQLNNIGTLPNLPGGSIVMTIGTIASGSIVQTTGTVNTGTINVATINAGTINIGTVVGKDANAAAQSGNPLGVGGTDSGGTIRTWAIDANGIGRTKFDTGTISSLPNLPGGSISVTTGTIASGSIAVTTGTVNAGTINTGTINTGTINLGTVVGKDANAAAQSGNPIGVGGTDSGGTIRTIKVDSSGLAHTLMEIGTISTLPNLPQGSINVTAGTVNAGTINTGTINTGTINVGTVRNDRPANNIKSYGTQVAFTGAAAATIIGSTSVGAGTFIWMNDVSIFNDKSGAGTFILGFGTAQQGTNVLLRAALGTNGAVGVQKAWPQMANAGMTNQDLVLSATGAGTIELTLSYLISA